MIWYTEVNLEKVNGFNKNTLVEHLGIDITEFSDDSLTGVMTVDSKTHQPFGVLHGGASCVLAESVGSIASNMIVDPKTHFAVGQTISANHVRPVSSGQVKCVAKIKHLGRKSHIWDINIYNEDQKLVCFSTLTMAIVQKA